MSFKNAQNYYFPNWNEQRQAPTTKTAQHNLGRTITPVQLQRLRQDVLMWRDAIVEAEHAYYPHRVRMQQMYIDTIIEGHTKSCMERRRDLTLLRDFIIVDEKGEEVTEWTKFFKRPWFDLWQTYVLDSIFFGYSLIAHGDQINDEFPELTIVKRWNVSPDRNVVSTMVYQLDGTNFLEDPYKDWHTWVPTPTETGASNCGYGLLYSVAIYAIFLRNILGQNGDAAELYAQPYRVGRTDKTEEDERGEFAAALQQMGSSGWALLDRDDSIEFLETALGATGYQVYDNFEQRLEKKISKLILGHADAMDSTPGKLGGGQDGEDSPVAEALKAKKTKDGALVENTFNSVLLPKLRAIGINIPLGFTGKFKNDEEAEAMRRKEDESNKMTADIAQVMKNAGLQMSTEYFEERTGIPCEIIAEAIDPTTKKETVEELEDEVPKEDSEQGESDEAKENKGLTEKIKNRLNKMYSL